MASYVKIFPPIGIARVGDSDTEWFLGPETPGAEISPSRGYRDAQGRLKRQAACFRLYAFDEADRLVGEITTEQARIEWSVELGNKKASWFPFSSGTKALEWFDATVGKDIAEVLGHTSDLGLPPPRNPSVGLSHGDGSDRKWDAGARRRLEILSSATVGAPADDIHPSITARLVGQFDGGDVFLGEISTDLKGRLIVLGGLGRSGSTRLNGADPWIRNYANNDGWHDDVSDGPVTASVQMLDGTVLPVRHGAWVIVAPPDFAPATENLVSAFDVIDEVTDHYGIRRPPELPAGELGPVQFWRDVYPIIRRLDGFSWVSDIGLRGHGFRKPGAMDGDRMAKLADPLDAEGAQVRRTIAKIIRKPFAWYPEERPGQEEKDLAFAQSTHRFMPPLSGDEGDTVDGHPKTWLSLTPRQYGILQAWASGDFVEGNPVLKMSGSCPDGVPGPRELTIAALEACTGGAFFPGIELTSIVKSPRLYSEAFRFDHGVLAAGDVTKWMACPWQADFWECQMHWWPAQRPDSVVREQDFVATLKSFPLEEQDGKLPAVLFPRADWARGIGTARPSLQGILDNLISPAEPAELTDALLAGVQIRNLADALRYRIRRIWSRQVVPAASYPTQDLGPLSKPEFAERMPSPWRLQFLMQEAIDGYSGRFFAFEVPRCEDLRLEGMPSPQDWDSFRRDRPADAASLLDNYRELAIDALVASVSRLLEAATPALTPEECRRFLALKVPADRDPSIRDTAGLAVGELLNATADAWYLFKSRKAGDMDMVSNWARHGIVTPKTWGSGPQAAVAYVETGRAPYDGLSYGDYFHILQNSDAFPGALELASTLADQVLSRADQLIRDTKGADQLFVETAFPYTPELFEAKMEEVYEYYRALNQAYRPWESDVTREEQIIRILKLAPFNQLDGSWLRFVADAGATDAVHGLLFEIWRDEVGNGNPAEHHGNLYTALLRTLGHLQPDTASKEYVDRNPYPDSYFVSPAFELAISAHTRKYLPEILGMTLFLEWEVLELAPGVRRWDYLGIDSKFLRMHVGIDNAVDGHGAKAKLAVRDFLDVASREGGNDAVQEQWARIWRGFVAFSAPMDNYLPDEDDVLARRPKGVQERLVDLIEHKRPYANRNHGQKRLGAERLNDLFEYPEELLGSLAASQWIVPGHPDRSRLLTYLTTYDGPMYKVFDESELALWAEWITWLGKVGGTERPKTPLGKADAMLRLLEVMRNGGLGTPGHDRFKVGGRSMSDWFGESDLRHLMRALRDDESGWVCSGSAEESALVVDQLRADRPMGKALDRRWPELNGRIGRLVIVEWIEAGCPIPGEPGTVRKASRRTDPGTLKPARQTLVQAFGQGSVH